MLHWYLIMMFPFGDYSVAYDYRFLGEDFCKGWAIGFVAAELAAEQNQSGVAYCVEASSVPEAFDKVNYRE